MAYVSVGDGCVGDDSLEDGPLEDGPPEDRKLANSLEAGPPPDWPPWVAAEEIRAMRRRLRVTQREFAGWFGFAASTLRHWERGNRVPTGPALVLLTVIRDNPRAVIQAVRKARLLRPGCLPEIEPLESYRAPPGFGERPPPLRKRGPRRPR